MRAIVEGSAGMDTWKTEDLGHAVAGLLHWKACYKASQLDGSCGILETNE